jgi:hypothetical protein
MGSVTECKNGLNPKLFRVSISLYAFFAELKNVLVITAEFVG